MAYPKANDPLEHGSSGFLRERQTHRDPGPASTLDRALSRDAALVRLDDPFRDGKAEPGALAPIAEDRPAHEPLKHARQDRRRDPWTVVPNREKNVTSVP